MWPAMYRINCEICMSFSRNLMAALLARVFNKSSIVNNNLSKHNDHLLWSIIGMHALVMKYFNKVHITFQHLLLLRNGLQTIRNTIPQNKLKSCLHFYIRISLLRQVINIMF